MAYFAKLDAQNRVTHVSAVADARLDPANEEASGIAFLRKIHGADTAWKQTSYNGSIRFRFAGIGYTYDEGRDAFLAPKPHPSWVLDEQTTKWKAPVDPPVVSGGASLLWNEETGAWQVIISKVDFDNRFTQAEWTTINGSTDEVVKRLRSQAQWMASNINLSDQRVIDGVNYLEATGVIGAGRATEVLDPNPTP